MDRPRASELLSLDPEKSSSTEGTAADGTPIRIWEDRMCGRWKARCLDTAVRQNCVRGVRSQRERFFGAVLKMMNCRHT